MLGHGSASNSHLSIFVLEVALKDAFAAARKDIIIGIEESSADNDCPVDRFAAYTFHLYIPCTFFNASMEQCS